MGTQALLTIVTRDELSNTTVVAKMTVGRDGRNVYKFAEALRDLQDDAAYTTPETVFTVARQTGYDVETLVLTTSSGCFHQTIDDDDDDVSDSYAVLAKKTFNDPYFNPRWLHGTAEHTIIVVI